MAARLISSLFLLALAGRAEAQYPAVPEAFRGEWATNADHCYLPHESNLDITDRLFGFRPMPGVVASMRSVSDMELEVSLDSADGRSSETRRFALSPDRRRLTDLTDRSNPVTRMRCDMPRQRIMGLVEIPKVYGAVNAGQPGVEVGPVTLHVEPNRDSATAATILHPRQLVTAEHGYEQQSAVVYSRKRGTSGRGNWYKLGYAEGDETGYGWLDPASAGTYHDVRTLISQGLSYMTDDWDRRLFSRPESGAAVRTVEGRNRGETPGARIVSIWNDRATGEDWYLVAVVSGQCSEEPLEITATGWVPAYAPNGPNTVWYYSRGC